MKSTSDPTSAGLPELTKSALPEAEEVGRKPKCPRCGEEATYRTPDGAFWDSSAHCWLLPARPDEPMTSEEFLTRVRAILDPLERMQKNGGGYLPDIIETGDAMERLADRWYRRDVKADLAQLDKSRAKS